MRKHLLTTVVFGLVVAARATPARADVGLGVFLGEPTGLDLKVGLGYRSGLDIVLGFTRLSSNADGYGHVTYLVTPFIGQGDAVTVPLRVGIGGAVFGTRNDLELAIRAPFEIGVRLRRSPVEFYGEIALAFVFVDPAHELELDVQGGGGFRVYF
jgi:hypothetical protein